MDLLISIEPLSSRHNRKSFTCGQDDLDEWFRNRASQDEKRNIARVFVAVDGEGILGFYSLGSHTLTLDDLPSEVVRKLPRYEALPAALIGRLARAERARGQGIGELLLVDAIRRILAMAQSVAVFAILVDAKDDRAAEFYLRFGFRPFPTRPSRLYLSTSVAAEVFGTSIR